MMPTAEKDLFKLETKIAEKILSKIELLSSTPRPNNSKKLSNQISYRLRVGDYRALYNIDEIKKEIVVFRIMHRSKVYKQL